MANVGCQDFRVVSSSPVAITDANVAAKVGATQFKSVTIRAFKLDLVDRCEDYGQVAYYLGTIADHPVQFALDDHHLFEAGKPMLVCSNTASMIAAPSRYAKHFRIVGDTKQHYGLFDCAPIASAASGAKPTACC